MTDLTFQVISWYSTDTEVEGSGDESEDQDDLKYVIKMFGRTEDGKSVSVSVLDFQPHFYVKLVGRWTSSEVNRLNYWIDEQAEMRRFKLGNFGLKIFKRKDFVGFTNNKLWSFLRISCSSLKTMRYIGMLLQNYNGRISSIPQKAFKLYESNIDPFLRFSHIKNIDACGWVCIKQGTYRLNDDVLCSKCDVDIKTKWTNVDPVPKDIIAPLRIASFDIECMSSDGDFPVAIKDYKKIANESFLIYMDLTRKHEDMFEVKQKIIKNVLDKFHSKKIFAKEKIDFENMENTLWAHIDHICNIFENKQLLKGEIIDKVTQRFNNHLPALEGDEIIQIGFTLHKYGESSCYKKILLSLGSCDPIDGVDVKCYENERELLLGWLEVMDDEDPDVLTGYNIFGFDFLFMYERAKELGCSREFCKIGRLKDFVSEFKEAKLSSSALGDNVMYFVDAQGRTLIDLMKVVQRDHKLDSYKLDLVASHFMKQNKKDVSPQDIFRLYKQTGKERAIIGDYCIQDCCLVNHLIMKLETIANNMGMANVCNVPLSFIFLRGQGIKIFSLVAKKCKEEGFLIPTINKYRKPSDDDVAADDEDGYEGAIVLPPKTGIYIDDPVSVLDYASLYPSSMISENLSHDCLVLDREKYGNIPGMKYSEVCYDIYNDKKEKVDERRCLYAQPEEGGVIPQILIHLLKQRKATRKRIGMKKVVMNDGTEYVGYYKDGDKVIFTDHEEKVEIEPDDVASCVDYYNNFQKAVLDGLQLAYKITANSLYGQIGAKTSAIYLKDIAACTTAVGRRMIMLAKNFLEEHYQADIVYGDSVTGDTPLLVRYPNGVVDIRTIETLVEEGCWKPYHNFVKEGDQKEQGYILAQVWSKGQWADINRVIRHKTTKKMYRVNTFRGCVDITEDHSLVDINGNKVAPKEFTEDTEIYHTFPTEFAEINIPVKCVNKTDEWKYEEFPDIYDCSKCGEQYDVSMYYVGKSKRRSAQCKLCVKERQCKRLGKEFDGTIGEKILNYVKPSYTITKEEAWVWGFFFGDGSCGAYDCSSGFKYSWAINNSNMMFLDKAKKYLENIESCIGSKFKMLDTLQSSGVYKLVPVGSIKYMVDKYRELFYDKDDYKKVPTLIINAPKEIQMAFMKGYLTADGAKKEMSCGKWDFACKGKIGAQGLFYLMKSLGFKDIGVNIRDDKENIYFIRTLTSNYMDKNRNKIRKYKEIPTSEFVYDIETSEGVFHGGVGECLLFNTDSLFSRFPVQTRGLTGKEALAKSIQVAKEASDKIKPLLKRPHDLEYEKTFWPFILFSKKRYVANKYEFDTEHCKRQSMGIVLKRRDNAQIVKHIYGGAIDIILNEHNIIKSTEFLQDCLEKLVMGQYPLEDLVITKTLKGSYKDPDKIAHKVLAERIAERSPGNAPQINDRIPFVYIEVKEDKREKLLQGNRIEHPDYIREKKLKPDYHFYITHQIMQPVLQLYAIVLEQLPKYRKSPDYWVHEEQRLTKEHGALKAKDKLQDLKEKEVKCLLFSDVLRNLENKRNNMKTITSYFQPHKKNIT
jgi:DNA polymerase elongation subunit (family B)